MSQPVLVDYRAGERHGGRDDGGILLSQEEQVALFTIDARGNEVLRESFAARHEFGAGGGIHAIAARFQELSRAHQPSFHR